MKYGHFSKDGTEFIITRPETPRPWINYLTNERYCAIISQCAGGYSFVDDCRDDRITRWAPDGWHFDRPGRYVYVREVKSQKSKIKSADKPRVWSTTFQPMRVKPERFEARHGLGYTAIMTEYAGLRARTTFFVPQNDPCEVWLVELANASNRARALELFPYLEWLLGDYHEELRYRNIMNLYNRVWFDDTTQAILAKKTARWKDMNIQPFGAVAFLASSLPARGWVTHKDAFLGRYNTEERPAMLCEGPWKNVPLCSGEDGVAVLRHRVTMAPHSRLTFTVVAGQTDQPERLSTLLATYRDVHRARQALADTQALWRRRILDNVWLETPDRDLNVMANIWVKYQLYVCNIWSRSPSFYHEGSGGRGFRDSCQDAESMLALNPDHARRKILKIASLMRRDGTCAPGWSDTRGPAGHRPNKDHPVWLTATVSAYIKETGDADILKERAPYLKDQWIRGWEVDPAWKGGAIPDGEGTLLEHLEQNVDFTFHDVGERGLPRIGHADWNDAIDAAGIRGKGESVWLAMALVRSLKMLAELCALAGQPAKAQQYREWSQAMTERINRQAWDGQWYARGFTDDGTPYGIHTNDEGKIFINTQSWALLSGVADDDRRRRLLRSADRHLDGRHGYALFHPAYSTWNPTLGRISMFSEGTKENAAVFCHAATFMIVANLMARRGNVAYRAMKKIMPNAQADYELYKTEPYVYAEYLVGPENPSRAGEGAFTWITGTSGWTFLAMTEWLLGIRREYDGLRIDPCIPSQWRHCRMRRPFRGAIYEIVIRNPRGMQSGVAEVRIDGKAQSGTLIRPHGDGRVHHVDVLMGPTAKQADQPTSTPAATASRAQ